MSTTDGSNIDKPQVKELRRLKLFERYNKEDIKQMLACMDEEHYEMGKILFQTGEPYSRSLIILTRGRVGLWGPHGEKYEVDPGTVLGLSNYVDGLPFTFTAIALTPITVLVARDAGHPEMKQICPVLHRTLMQLIAGQIRGQTVRRLSFAGGMTRPARAVMRSPLAKCGPDITIAEAYKVMDERRIGSLIVTQDDGTLLGLLTFAGMAGAMVDGATGADNVLEVACQPAYAVSPDTPLWEVEELQQRHALKYVIVTDGRKPVGMISQTDILDDLLTQNGGAREEVRRIDSFAKLGKMNKRLVTIAKDAREHNQRATAAATVISNFHLAVQRRCVELILEDMKANGPGPAPSKFALLIMGSGGRREMMLSTDQDNAIIIGEPDGAVSKKGRDWFMDFGKRVNVQFAELGYVPSRHGIMAGDAAFVKTTDEWRSYIVDMVSNPEKATIHRNNLLLDFNTLYGDDDLTETLRQHAIASVREHSGYLKAMAKSNAEAHPPREFLNQLIPAGLFGSGSGKSGKGKIDIKHSGLRILVDVLRIYALRAGIRNRNSMDRLEGLVRTGALSTEAANSIRVAFEALTDMLITHQIQQAESGKSLDKLIKPKQLSESDYATLRIAMRVIKNCQETLQGEF